MKLINYYINIISSRSERERERESSLNFASSLKKSFTLIELSIVLLILSLLVGSLLVGRQIVDRAKIQRIIFEFDYYEKAFHQFYDTYRVVPGNFTYKDCIKYSEFNSVMSYRTDGNSSGRKLCNDTTSNLVPPSKKLLSPVFSQAKWMAAGWTYLAGLTAERIRIRGDGSSNWSSYSTGMFTCSAEGQVYASNQAGGFRYFPQASFNSEMNIGYHGFDDVKLSATSIYDYKYNFQVYNFNPSDQYETSNQIWKQSAHKHNTIFIVNSNLGCPCTDPHVNCSCKNSRGALSAKMTSELDAKIDDGRPATGNILAIKNDYVHQATKPSEAEINRVCYDKPIAQVSSALYEESSDLRFGCNVYKVMEDVK